MTRKRILLLDDSPLALEMTQAALEQEGYEVAIALDLATFELRRAETSPDLILIDVQMPEAFGHDVAATLRGARQERALIVLLSGLDEPLLAQRAAEAEVDGWISKRAGVAELLRRVREILS